MSRTHDIPEPPSQRRWAGRGVVGVSLASFFSDTGHEITTSLLPAFLIGLLGGTSAVLGVIEGISDALLGVAQLIAGPFVDRPERRREIAGGGYLMTAIATGAVGVAATVWQAGILRAAGWIARGARSPARDSLLASLIEPGQYGRAFGLERAGDNLGAVVGPLLAALLVTVVGIRPTMYLAAVPGLFAVVAFSGATRTAPAQTEPGEILGQPETRGESEAAAGPETPRSRRPRLPMAELADAGIIGPVLPIGLFECGNCATTLLILRATDILHREHRSLVAATSFAVVLYAANNLLAAASSMVGGRWIDRGGGRLPFAIGALLLAVGYIGFGADLGGWLPLLVAFTLTGAGVGLVEPAESVTISRLLPDRLRGSGFGLLGGVQACGDLVASALVGVLWWLAGPAAAFACAAALLCAAAATSSRLSRGRQR